MLLNCKSWFSLTYGVMSPEQLLQEAMAQGITAMALTDINCTAGLSDFFRLAPQYKVRPVAGIEYRSGARILYIGIAQSNTGLYHLNELLTRHTRYGEALPLRPPPLPDVVFIHPFGNHVPTDLRADEYIGIRATDLNKARFSPIARKPEKLLALTSATFRHKRDHNVHRLLRAVDTNTLLTCTPPEHVADERELLVSEEQLFAQFALAPDLLQNTRRLLDQCDVHFGFGQPKNLRTWSGAAQRDRDLLLHEAQAGLVQRYGAGNAVAMARLEKELTVILQKDYVSYFLINWDLIQFAKRKGFFHVGRGSGANSIAAYALGITDVDPIELDLYFERFINPSRSSPPDFDLDFSWKDRDQVTQYLFDRYGKDHRVALLATYITLQPRAAVHELGKVFGLPPAEIERLGDMRQGRLSSLDKVGQSVLKYSELVRDIPKNLSIHVGGVLISEKPLTHYTALHLPPKGFTTTQFSMLEAEDLGLHKFDILSQRGLGHIRDAVELVEHTRGERIDIHDIPKFKEDAQVRELIHKGDTIGAFYVESPAMRMLLKKLRVHTYLELVAASSIIRPGVSSSGMMREYILRHHDPERRKLAHPKMMEIMPETYGVMVYQEDVIKVAHLYAGLTLAEADILRRGMSGKYRSRAEFARVQERWFQNCRTKGYSDDDAQEIWRQTESFAGYSFAKGHSASYAVESYQSLYLKAYWPLEFMVAVANNFGGFYHTEFYLNEARNCGAVLEAPCINRSEALCSLHGVHIVVGLGMIKGMPEQVVHTILAARQREGPFTSLGDLLHRVPLHPEHLRLLIRVGALRFTGHAKPHLLWEMLLYQQGAKPAPTSGLFPREERSAAMPELTVHGATDAFDELELLGYPISDPYRLLAEWPLDTIAAADMAHHCGQRVRMLGYVVHVKPATTKTGERMEFGCYMDRHGRLWDGVHFPDVALRYPILGRGIHLLTGRIEEEFGHYSMQVEMAERLPYKQNPVFADHAALKKPLASLPQYVPK